MLQVQLLTKFRITAATVYIPRYRIHWQQSCQGKAAAGGCPSALGSGALQQPVPAPASCAGAASTSQFWWHLRKGSPSTRQSPTVKTEEVEDLEVWNSSLTWIEAPRARQGPKQAWKPAANRSPECVLRQQALVKVGSQRYTDSRYCGL